jgi:23S rRNA (uracil1939-C5)-methyltransferase
MKLAIEKSIYGGAGLARAEGKAIFVPVTLPGELVEAQVTKDRGSYAEAELVTVLEPSPARVAASCPYYGECGGCHYQHASYIEQLAMKKQILLESLERARLSAIPGIEILSGEPLHYRNRARFHLDHASSMLCYKKRASHENLPVDACPISSPLIEEAIKTLNADRNALQLAKHFDEAECFTNGHELLLTFWTTQKSSSPRSYFQALWTRLKAILPRLSGSAVFSTERENRRPTLVTNGAAGSVAWDLYAGAGLFARLLASRFAQVVAVESAPSSVQDLRHNLSGTSHRVVASSTLEFLRRAGREKKGTADFVVVDPPRAGLGKEVTALLGELRPRNITYVSCDPATLSRDLKSLLDSGYSLKRIHMVDMFPQTFHLESVAMLSLM